MTKTKQYIITRQAKRQEDDMDSPIKYPNFPWAPRRSQDYMKAIDNINDAYRKMLRIGEAKKVFRERVCPMMTAKTKEECQKAR